MMGALTEAAVIALTLSIDAFAAGLAYGGKKIKIPMASVMIINLICSVVIGVSLSVGTLARQYIPPRLASGAAFTILFTIGMVKLLDGVTKSIIKRHSDLCKEIKISMFNFKFILKLYAKPEEADIDASKSISPSEAAALALSLSLDGIAAGFGIALTNVNVPAVFIWSLITDILAIKLGHCAGLKIADRNQHISWLGGGILIALAVSKLL